MNSDLDMRKVYGLPFFSGITPEEAEALLGCTQSIFRHFRRGERIFLEKYDAYYYGMVVTGQIHAVRNDLQGRSHMLTCVREGELFGQPRSFRDNILPEHVYMAAKDSEIMFLSPDLTVHTCRRNCPFHQKLTSNLFRLLSDIDLRMKEKIEIISRTSLRDKLITFFMIEARRQKSAAIRIPMSREELAEYLAANRSSMIRELSRLQEEGLLLIQGRMVTLNPEKLPLHGPGL